MGTISSTGAGTAVYTAPAMLPAQTVETVTAVSVADSAANASATVNLTDNIVIVVSPSTASVPTGGAQVFTASITPSGSPGSVTWSVNGVAGGNSTVGAIVSTGAVNGTATALYTAPAVPPSTPTVTVTATSVADTSKSGSATATITCSATASISPMSASVALGQTQPFTATFCAAAGTSVVWDEKGIVAGNSTLGTIIPTGANTATYTARKLRCASAVKSSDDSRDSDSRSDRTCDRFRGGHNNGSRRNWRKRISSDVHGCGWSTRDVHSHGHEYVRHDRHVVGKRNSRRQRARRAGLPAGIESVRGTHNSRGRKHRLPQGTGVRASHESCDAHGDQPRRPFPKRHGVDFYFECAWQRGCDNFTAIRFRPLSSGISSTQQFSAQVTGTTNTGVTWSVQSGVAGQGCAGAACGSISASGLYSAPGTAPSPNAISIVATSQADLTTSASATVSIASGAAIEAILPSSTMAGAVESFPLAIQGVNFVAGSGSSASVILINGVVRGTTCSAVTSCVTVLNPSDACNRQGRSPSRCKIRIVRLRFPT